ncbi:MAG TPA: SPFH domain-containing protein, partial [Candidatus Saccharimonadales bacterium]|nr:SPFH domain-containing protein [Candidatus Saccharimonadales bacterium]
MEIASVFTLLLLFAALGVIISGIKIVKQYERGVVLTLGRYTGMREPGMRVVIPVLQMMSKVDVRSTPVDVPSQEVITKDNVSVKVDAVVY